jgi:dTDP-4-amino-4,6-dideoxygalactose transaminase
VRPAVDATAGLTGVYSFDMASMRQRDKTDQSGGRVQVREVAYKYKMSALQAAFGLAQLERIEELVARKRKIFPWYAQHANGPEWHHAQSRGTKDKKQLLDSHRGFRTKTRIAERGNHHTSARP